MSSWHRPFYQSAATSRGYSIATTLSRAKRLSLIARAGSGSFKPAAGVLRTEDSFEPCPELTRATQSRERL